MEFQDFIKNIDEMGYVVATFSTYTNKDQSYFSIVVLPKPDYTKKVNKSMYYRSEGTIDNLEKAIFDIWFDIRRDYENKINNIKNEKKCDVVNGK